MCIWMQMEENAFFRIFRETKKSNIWNLQRLWASPSEPSGASTADPAKGLVLCDTWNWSDDNDTVSGITILDTAAIPEMCSAISVSFRIHQSQ